MQVGERDNQNIESFNAMCLVVFFAGIAGQTFHHTNELNMRKNATESTVINAHGARLTSVAAAAATSRTQRRASSSYLYLLAAHNVQDSARSNEEHFCWILTRFVALRKQSRPTQFIIGLHSLVRSGQKYVKSNFLVIIWYKFTKIRKHAKPLPAKLVY